ncbi:macrolide family glycosyltransferase [Streptosporangium minutum]|uniref:Glycosyl transferase n=1 Tax=Streptosporangium minutum TaxID=569862 RepID=A0A243RA15_9ACTN|nr:macrolide family glycosyltransferase [Streptosporangium minutum]OUC91492.1 glycosyl transferase [Streptosporangium minutum]
MPRRAHIAMVSIPAPGHVNPSLEVIRELAARGHRVTYANDPSFAEVIEGAGAEPVPYASTLPMNDPEGWPEDTIAQLDVFLNDSVSMLPQLRDAYGDDRPDLFLYDIAGYSARVLAENWGIPAMQLSPSYVAWEGYKEDTAPMVEELKKAPGGAEHYRRFDQWLVDNGITGTDSQAFVGYPERALALIPRMMQPNADRVDPARITFTGPCLGARAHQEAWTRPEGAEKVLLVSLGSAFTNLPGFYRSCLAAFGDLPGWHVVLQIGKLVDPAELGEIPANVEVHSWVSQLSILEQADAFVTHAGMGGTQEGLYCGVPMIAIPQGADQFDNADKIVELGAGRRIDTAQATPEALRAALLELTSDPEVALRLEKISAEVRAEGGTARAADLVERLLETATPTRAS